MTRQASGAFDDRRSKPERNRTRRFERAAVFLLRQKIAAVLAQHSLERARAFALFEVQQTRVVGESFEQPVVLIAGRTHHVAPPLMRHLVCVEDVGEEGLLTLVPTWRSGRSFGPR